MCLGYNWVRNNELTWWEIRHWDQRNSVTGQERPPAGSGLLTWRSLATAQEAGAYLLLCARTCCSSLVFLQVLYPSLQSSFPDSLGSYSESLMCPHFYLQSLLENSFFCFSLLCKSTNSSLGKPSWDQWRREIWGTVPTPSRLYIA